MKRGMRFILCTVAALGFAPIAAWAQSCDTTFEPKDKDGYDVDEGAWQDDDNWTNDAPGSGDVGCVPSGKTANVYKKYCKGGLTHGLDCSGTACVFGTCYEDPDIEAGAVVLDGTLELHYYTSLTISDDSVDSEVNGEMIVRPYAKIVTDGDVTITGDEGGEIFGAYIVCAYTHPQIDYVKRCDGGTNDGEICEDNEDCPGDPPGVCTAQTLTLDGDLLLHGRWYIDAPLINNATVDADNIELPIVLQDKPKSGSGTWMSSLGSVGSPPAGLWVDIEVTGTGTWKLDSGAGRIEFNTVCDNLSGNFELTAGELAIDNNVTTTGNLDMTGGKIVVAEGKSVSFD